MKDHFSDRSVDVSRYSPLTMQVIQELASTNRPLKAKEIASFLKISYKTAHKILRRLVKRGIAEEDNKYFFTFNHHDPMLFPTRSRDVSMLELHRVGLYAVIPRLRENVLAAGRCFPSEWEKGIGCRPRTPFEGVDLRLFNDSAYYLESCEPFPMRNLMLRYERFIRMIDHYTKELADFEDVFLSDFEIGMDIPFDTTLWELLGLESVIFYRPKGRKKGMLRMHVQRSKGRHRLPLDEDTKLRIVTDFITALDDINYAINTTFQTLIQTPPLTSSPQRNRH